MLFQNISELEKQSSFKKKANYNQAVQPIQNQGPADS